MLDLDTKVKVTKVSDKEKLTVNIWSQMKDLRFSWWQIKMWSCGLWHPVTMW